MLKVKEVFYSLQGEGLNVGRPAVFVRFSGCNMWDGSEARKAKSGCPFCDTDFVGGESYSDDSLAELIAETWKGTSPPFIVFTGGEPTLQLTNSLLSSIRKLFVSKNTTCDFAIETNGSSAYIYDLPVWITVSPKMIPFERKHGGELKLLWPLPSLHPDNLGDVDFKYKYLQPIFDENYADNLRGALEYCLNNSDWRLSTQQHKTIGIR